MCITVSYTIYCSYSVSCIYIYIVAGQGDVTENIGFGQEADSVREGEVNKNVRVRLGPAPVNMNVSGRIVPLTLSQYMNYNFSTPRTVPQSVQETVTMNTTDPAECQYISLPL